MKTNDEIGASMEPLRKQAEDGWIQEGPLLYRLTDERRPKNRDEIIVTMANSSRTEEARTRRAGELLDAIRAAAPQECSRSHPHEEMTPMCELRTEIARLTNALARAEAAAPQAVQAAVPDGWKRVPIKVPDSAFAWVSGGYPAGYKAWDERDTAVVHERAQRAWEAILNGITAPAHPAEGVSAQIETLRSELAEEKEAADNWRRLALQFDNHRLQALWHLKRILHADSSVDEYKAAEQFLAAPPLDGEAVLAQRIAALAATQPAAQGMDAGKLLAEKHTGMKVDYRGLLGQVQREIERSAPGHAEMLRQLQGHLQELGQRWYAGDTAVVDELLQLYCVERQARADLAAQAKQGGA